MIFVVLGMHKSGTTLVAQILHHSGVNMGDHFDENTSYDQGNKYEREESLDLNLDILGVNYYRIIDVSRPEQPTLTPAQRARMREIIQECNARHTHWGFKDPRTTIVYPLWRSELPEHKLIAVYRPPEEIWPRFRYNGVRYAYTNPYLAWQFMSRWYEHNAAILKSLQDGAVNSLLLNYQKLLYTDTEFERLEKFVGFKLDDRRNKKLHRSRREKSDYLLKMAGWLIQKRTGRHPDDLQKQLQALWETQQSHSE